MSTLLTVEVLEWWRVCDKWWTQTPLLREFVEARWGDRTLIFVREPDRDPTWRIYERPACA